MPTLSTGMVIDALRRDQTEHHVHAQAVADFLDEIRDRMTLLIPASDGDDPYARRRDDRLTVFTLAGLVSRSGPSMDTAEHALRRFLDRLDQHRARLDTIRQQIVTVIREEDQPAPGSLLDLGDQMAVHDATVAAATQTTSEIDLASIDQFRNYAARMIADILIIGDLQDARIQVEDWPQPLLPTAALQALSNRIRQDATGDQPG